MCTIREYPKKTLEGFFLDFLHPPYPCQQFFYSYSSANFVLLFFGQKFKRNTRNTFEYVKNIWTCWFPLFCYFYYSTFVAFDPGLEGESREAVISNLMIHLLPYCQNNSISAYFVYYDENTPCPLKNKDYPTYAFLGCCLLQTIISLFWLTTGHGEVKRRCRGLLVPTSLYH